ncbi:hypothetical protein GF402_03975 [Candidatus Fermentibacteria bacterium]|nr:hypothetical protein [Candidatus Fermentibacteria bacterium]
MARIVVPLLLYTLCAANAQTMDLLTGLEGPAELRLLRCTPTSLELELRVPELQLRQLPDGSYTIAFPGATIWASEDGMPMLPKVSFLAALPPDPNPRVSVECPDTVWLDPMKLSPMRPIPTEDGTYRGQGDRAPAPQEGWYPSGCVQWSIDGVLRGVTVGRFGLVPVLTDPTSGRVGVLPVIRLSIDMGASIRCARQAESRFFNRQLRGMLLNGEILPKARSVLHSERNGQIPGAEVLILAGDGFYDLVQDLAVVRRQQGFPTAVVSAEGWDRERIAGYIRQAYQTWSPPPSFVLFAGDSDFLPPAYSESTGVWTDNRYCCVDGSDFMADIYYGRLAVSPDEYGEVEQKILRWDLQPLHDPTFWRSALNAGAFQDADSDGIADLWFCFTNEALYRTLTELEGRTVHREYVKTGQYDSLPLYYRPDPPSTGGEVPMDIEWAGTAEGVNDRINRGVFFLQQRSHGTVESWACPLYHKSQLENLDNGFRTPIVMSINCHTGDFTQDCLAECFLGMEGGAVGVFAATGESYSYYNDYLCYGIHMSFLEETVWPPTVYTDPYGSFRAGQALFAGKLEMQAAAPGSPYPEDRTEEEWDLFHFLGDPLLDMRSGVPVCPEVDAPERIEPGATSATFTVSTISGRPVPGALVCLRKPDEQLYSSGLTDSTGTVTLVFQPLQQEGLMPWMVSGHDLIPLRGEVGATGVEEDEPSPPGPFEVSIAPIPARGSIEIVLRRPDPTLPATVRIFDLAGRCEQTVEIRSFVTTSRTTYDCSELAPGLYMVRAESGSLYDTCRLLVLGR